MSQLQLKKKIRKCFEEGLAASTASRKTGTNIKTACKYYQQWAREIEEAQNADFLERQKEDRAQTIVSYDSQIVDAGAMLEQINEEIKRYQTEKKSIPKHLMGYTLEFMKHRSSLVERKTAFIMQPTMDEALDRKIQEKIEEYEKSRKDS